MEKRKYEHSLLTICEVPILAHHSKFACPSALFSQRHILQVLSLLPSKTNFTKLFFLYFMHFLFLQADIFWVIVNYQGANCAIFSAPSCRALAQLRYFGSRNFFCMIPVSHKLVKVMPTHTNKVHDLLELERTWECDHFTHLLCLCPLRCPKNRHQFLVEIQWLGISPGLGNWLLKKHNIPLWNTSKC